MKSRLFAGQFKSVGFNLLWLTWRGVWRAVLLRSRARGGSASGVKSAYPDPKSRMSPRRKSLRGTFARLSLRKHRKRQVLANLRMCSWTNLSLVLVSACRANALNCWWTEPSNWLVQRRVRHAIWNQYSFDQSAACAAKFSFWFGPISGLF